MVLQQLCNGGILILDTLFGAGHANGQKTSAEWMLSENKRSTPGRTALLGITICENSTFAGDSVDIRCAATHHAAMVCADIPHADVITPDNEDVGFISLGKSVGRVECKYQQ